MYFLKTELFPPTILYTLTSYVLYEYCKVYVDSLYCTALSYSKIRHYGIWLFSGTNTKHEIKFADHE